jgi:twitching motility protein PilT
MVYGSANCTRGFDRDAAVHQDTMEQVQPESGLGKLLEHARQAQATHVHGQAEKPFTLRVDGQLKRVPTTLFPAPAEDAFDWLLAESFSPAMIDRIRAALDLDFSFHFANERFRANFSKQLGKQAFSFRHVPRQPPTLEQSRLSASLLETFDPRPGLLALGGSSAPDCRATLRALLQEINETRACRILTIEDPVERVFVDDLAQIEQREVGIDTPSCAAGLRSALPQDHDLIYVDQLPDAASVLEALRAAESGRAVLTALQAESQVEAVGRLLGLFPVPERPGIVGLLDRTLRLLVFQRRVPGPEGPALPELEVQQDPGVLQETIRAACSV